MADVEPEDVLEEGTVVPEGQPEADPEVVEELEALGSDDQPDPDPKSWKERLGEVVGASAAAALIDEGYLAEEALSAALDEALLEVKGVGPAALEKLRAFAPEHVEPVTPLQNVEEIPSDGEVQKSARVRRIHDAV